jgi:putative membrane protein
MASRAEIELGQLARHKAQDQLVRQFATDLINDHTEALEALQRITGLTAREPRRDVAELSQPMPTRSGDRTSDRQQLDHEHQQTYDRLAKLSGREFDREYMRVMVAEHQKAAEEFKRASGAAASRADTPAGTSGRTGERPQSVHEWVTSTLPTVESHLQRAQEIHSGIDSARTR